MWHCLVLSTCELSYVNELECVIDTHEDTRVLFIESCTLEFVFWFSDIYCVQSCVCQVHVMCLYGLMLFLCCT